MERALNRFVFAHDRYLALRDAGPTCASPQEREMMHIEIMKAYLEVQYFARTITGLQFADGMDFAEVN
jgi:hypothetical protein